MNSVKSVSYIGKPVSYTAMYITKKVEHLLENLEKVEGCMVFAENNITIPETVSLRHKVILTATPQRDYAYYVQELAEKKEASNSNRRILMTEEGYYIGENVILGANIIIEPGAFIGHDVKIGANSIIRSGARIKDTETGSFFIAGENSVVGSSGFTMAEDEEGNKIRIPTLGKVIVGNNVEVGALTNISCGSAGNTVIEDNVKLDSFVHIGHDAFLGKNVEIPAGAVVGGFCRLEEGAYVGINATLRNRIRVGKNSFVGMGSVVTKSVDDGVTVVGNPAKPFIKK